jgi:hypothetical protein
LIFTIVVKTFIVDLTNGMINFELIRGCGGGFNIICMAPPPWGKDSAWGDNDRGPKFRRVVRRRGQFSSTGADRNRIEIYT